MNPDEIAIRPVVYGNAVRPVHREAASRDATKGQRSPTPEPAEEPDETEVVEQEVQPPGEETHLIDLRA